MTTPRGRLPRTPRTQAIRETSVSVAYGLVINGVIVQVNDAARQRLGKRGYPFYVEKVQGYENIQDITGATGGARGGLMYIDPDTSNSDRSKIIAAYNNVIYMYIIDSDTLVTLRDVGTLDSKTIDFLSAIQVKRFAYFAIGDGTQTSLYKYSGTSTGSITVFADAGGGQVTVTSTAHGMSNGNTVTITGTTNYNGTFVISNVTANTYEITATFNGDDGTGTWTGETLTVETLTALNASRLLGEGDDRITAVGIGDNATINQYSKLKQDGDFTDFTSSTDSDGGGRWSGNVGKTTALLFEKGFQIIFERNRVSVHRIELRDQSSGLIKEVRTLNNDFSIEGRGTASANGAISVDGIVYFVDPRGSVYAWNLTSTNARDRLVELTSPFRPLLETFGFDFSAIGYDRKNNLLLVTASSLKNSVQDRILIYNFITKTWTLDNGKSVNQFLYDSVNEQTYGLASATNEIHKIFDGSYQNDNADISLSAETEMYDSAVPYRLKQYESTSVEVGAENRNQIINIKVFLDQNEGESLSEDRSLDGLIAVGQTLLGGWANQKWGTGTDSGISKLQFLTLYTEALIPDFQRISIQLSESSGYRTVFWVPEIRYTDITFPASDFPALT